MSHTAEPTRAEHARTGRAGTHRAHRRHWAVWLAAAGILVFAALLRLWALGRPDSLVFDELYYVRDAVSQLAHGFATTWPDDEPEFGGERARAFSDVASTIAHPPLGKWLIGLGILVFGPDSGWGWRASVALAGVATVAVTMRLGWVLTRSIWVSCVAGLLLAADGVHVVLSRVALLDGLLTLLVTTGALCVALHLRARFEAGGARGDGAFTGRATAWLVAAGVAFGAATAVKWSGLFACAAFLVFIVLFDVLRSHEDRWRRPLLRGLATAAIALPAAGVAYAASWAGSIVAGIARGEAWWVSLWQWHTNMFSWHATLTAEHPYQAHPLTWPLALRPTSMFREGGDGFVAAISPLPNLLVTWAGVLALALLAWGVARAVVAAVRERSVARLTPSVWVCGFVLCGYLSGWVPWLVLASRSAVFQFYAVVMTPFAALALALVIVSCVCDRPRVDVLALAGIRLDRSPAALQGRRVAVGIFLAAVLVVAVLFWPVWSGASVVDWFYEAHRWLPGWS